MTTIPASCAPDSAVRIASTAAPSTAFLSPRPTSRPAAMAAASVDRTKAYSSAWVSMGAYSGRPPAENLPAGDRPASAVAGRRRPDEVVVRRGALLRHLDDQQLQIRVGNRFHPRMDGARRNDELDLVRRRVVVRRQRADGVLHGRDRRLRDRRHSRVRKARRRRLGRELLDVLDERGRHRDDRHRNGTPLRPHGDRGARDRDTGRERDPGERGGAQRGLLHGLGYGGGTASACTTLRSDTPPCSPRPGACMPKGHAPCEPEKTARWVRAISFYTS